MTHKKTSHFLAVILMILWGLSYMSIEIAVADIAPPVVAFYRFAFASIIMFTILKIKFPNEKILKEDKLLLALGGLFGVAVYFFFENYAVAYTSSANVSILIATIPIFTVILQTIKYKEKMKLNTLLGTTFSVIGIIIIVTSKEKFNLFSQGNLGNLLALGAAISWVVYNVVTTGFKGNYHSFTIATYQAIWGTIFLSPSLLIYDIKMPSLNAGLNIIFLAVACSIIGNFLYIACLKNLGATVITTYLNLQPIVSVAASYFILKDNITWSQLLGCMIIIGSLFLVNLQPKGNKTNRT